MSVSHMVSKSFVNQSKAIIYLIVILYLILCLLSYYFNESKFPFYDSRSKALDFLAVALIGTTGWIIYFAKKRNGLMVSVLSIGLIGVFSSAYLAKQNVEQAFQDCRDRSEIIRQEINLHKSKHGEYPESLDQLKIQTCGSLIMHKPLLKYKKSKDDFELWFSDSFILYLGTSVNSMEAKK